MPQQKFSESWKKLLLTAIKMELLLLGLAMLGGCAFFSADPPEPPEPKVVVETKFIEKKVPIQAHPKGLKLNDVSWYVVTPDNINSLIPRFEKQLGDKWVFYVVEVRDYENLALNMADIKRYIIQQKKIIEYYEDALQDDNKTMENSE